MSSSDSIVVSTNALENIIQQLQQTQSAIMSQRNKINSVLSNLDKRSGADVRLSGGTRLNCGASIGSGTVKNVLSDCRFAIDSRADGIDDLAKTVNKVCTLFMETEKGLISRFNGMGIGNLSAFGTGSSAGNMAGITRNAFYDMLDGFKTGAIRVGNFLRDMYTGFMADWEAKGTSYRIIKGIGAVVQIVGGVASVVCALAGTGATAGAGAPVTALVAIYGVNSVISGVADLTNCISGNVEGIGKVNIVKSGLTTIGGQVGEWLGNRGMGEKVGEVAYIVGGVTTTVVTLTNLSGQIKQAHSAGNTLSQSVSATQKMFAGAADEVGTVKSQLGYLFSDIKNLPYNFSLFKHQIPNICNIASDASLVQKGVAGASKLIDAGVEITNTLAGWEMLKRPSLVNTVENLLPDVGRINEMKSNIEGLKDIKGSFENIQEVFAIEFM